jgi:hypothetical protein
MLLNHHRHHCSAAVYGLILSPPSMTAKDGFNPQGLLVVIVPLLPCLTTTISPAIGIGILVDAHLITSLANVFS